MANLRAVVLVAALLSTAAGCVRQIRPSLGGDRQLDTGVPVTLGSEHPDAPELKYDFGDGSPISSGKRVKHAYAQAGRYRVFAMHDEKPVDSVTFTVVPRRVTRAMPDKTNGAVYFRKISQNLERVIDFVERALGPDTAQNLLEGSPVMELGMELSAAHTMKERGIDAEEGLAIATIEGFNGTLGLIGVTEGEKALDAMVTMLTRGGKASWSGDDGTTRVRMRDGREAALLLDRGYLYLMVPDTPAPDPEFADAAPDELARDTGMNRTDFAPAVNAIKGSHALGFEGSGTLVGLEDRVSEGNVYLYVNADKTLPAQEQGAFASFRMKQDVVDVDGFYRSKRPWGVRTGVVAPMLASVPKGAVAALGLSIPPKDLARFFFGEVGSEQRNKANARAQKAGFSFEALLAVLTGDVSAAAYLDAKAAFAAMAKAASPAPQFKGSLVSEAGLSDEKEFERFLQQLFKEMPDAPKRSVDSKGTRYLGTVERQPFDLLLSADKVTVRAGEPTSSRETEDLGARLRRQFGAETFGAGHLSLLLDLARVREEIASVEEVAGVPREKVEMFKAFATAMMQQFPPIDLVFVDVSAADGGAKVSGRLVLGER